MMASNQRKTGIQEKTKTFHQAEGSQQVDSELSRLLGVMARLRDPETGCPWDLEQTYRTITPYTIEEAYEVADAVERGDKESLLDEAGDLLFQIVYYARLATEEGLFDFADIARQAADKMIQRHPNVFGKAKTPNAQAQIEAWETQKRAERRMKAETGDSELEGIPLALPALIRATKLANRAARCGFEWQTLEDIWKQFQEEKQELNEASGREETIDEFGDLLLTMVNIARWMDIDPETALRRANDKFERRFRALETRFSRQGRKIKDALPEEKEQVWEIIKQEETQSNKG